MPILLPGQQNEYDWRVGAYGGIMNYYGDLSHEIIEPNRKLVNFFDNLDYVSYGVSLERRLSNAFSAGLMYTEGQFVANDRKINWDGELQTDHARFERSLNARTELQDISAYLTYHFDNGHLLGIRSLVAPYLKASAGLTQFQVFGDLFYGTNQDQRYFYWDDHTIRDQPPESTGAMIVEQDGEFETRLDGLQTEGVDYNTTVFSAGAALGLKFHLGRFNINLESHWRWANTDYLDDVSGDFPQEFDSDLQQYASNPAGIEGKQRGTNRNRNDIYAFTSLSVHYNFARKQSEFRVPPITLGPLTNRPTADQPEEEPQDTSTTALDTLAAQDTAFAKMTADSLQQLVDSLRSELTQMKVAARRSNQLVADSLRQTADSLRTVADSLQQRADQLYPAPERRPQPAVEEQMDTLTWREAPPFFRDTLRVSKEIPPPDTSSVRVTPDAPLEPSAREGLQPDTTGQTPPRDTSIQTEKPPDQESRPASQDTSTSGMTDVRILQDTILRAEVTRLNQKIRTLSESIESDPDRDTVLRRQVNRLEEQLRQLATAIEQLQADRAAAPVRTDRLATEEQLERYQEELEDMRRDIETGQQEEVERTNITVEREEREELMEQYENTLEEMEAARQDDQERYQELSRELALLRRQLNIATAAPLDTRAPREAPDTLARSLQVRVDSLERVIQKFTIDTAATAPDSGANELRRQLFRIENRLDSLQQPSGTASPTLPDSVRMLLREQEELIEDLQTQLALSKQTEIPTIPAEAETEKSPLEEIGDRARQAVFFGSGSATLDPAGRQTIDDAIRLLRRYPKLEVRLEGFTDSSGSIQLNRRLSAQRTQAVKDYLVQAGISPQRIISAPQGIDRSANTAAFGRRVEVSLQEREE